MRGNVFQAGAVILVLLILSATTARAQESDFSLSAGYSHAFGTSNALFHSKSGAYFDGDFAWKLPVEPVPVSLGFGLTGSGYYKSRDVGEYYDGNGYGQTNGYTDVGFFEFEPRLTVTLWSTLIRGLFLKPRLGLGVLIDDYAADETYNDVGHGQYPYLYTQYHTGAAFEIRPSLQAGYTWGFGSAGVEASYMPAWGDFDRLGSSIQELRIGAFYTFRF